MLVLCQVTILTILQNNSLTPRPICDQDQAYIFLPLVQALMYLGYLVIFLVGVVGNIIVLVVVLTNPHMQTTTNIYVVNLSLADILMCLGTILYQSMIHYCDI